MIVPDKRYTVGEVAQHTGLSRQTIHNYCTYGIIRERERTPGRHRLFDEQVFYILREVEQLKADGMTMNAIIEHFKEKQS